VPRKIRELIGDLVAAGFIDLVAREIAAALLSIA
jgi:hypothetical protein